MKVIVFDFDGTLVDSISPSLKHINEMLRERGREILSPSEFKELRSLSYKDALKKLNIAFWQVPALALELRSRISREFSTYSFYPGIVDLLNNLAHEGKYAFFILTSNSKQNVKDLLAKSKIALFSEIYSEKNLFGKGITLGKIIKQNNWQTSEMIYVGDEVRDIEAAQQNNVAVVAVTWGLQSAPILENHKPTAIIHTPKELEKFIKNH